MGYFTIASPGIFVRREMQKPFYTESRTINTAMHGGLLYILLHALECSGIYFTGISANQIHLKYIYIFCNVKRNKVPFNRLVSSWG